MFEVWQEWPASERFTGKPNDDTLETMKRETVYDGTGIGVKQFQFSEAVLKMRPRWLVAAVRASASKTSG